MINILHVYPNLLNTFGGAAELKILTRYLSDNNIEYSLDSIETGEEIKLDKYDLIYLGPGTEDKTIVALKDFVRYKEAFNRCVEEGKCILMQGSSSLIAYEQLIGIDGSIYDGLGIIKGKVNLYQRKKYSDIFGYTNISKEGILTSVITSSEINGKECRPFINIKSDSNSLYNGSEGFNYNNLYGTELVGPLFARNPAFLKDFCKKYFDIQPMTNDPLWLKEAYKGHEHALFMMKVNIDD